MPKLVEVLRLDRALWAQVYERQMKALELGGLDHAQLEAALIADEALALAEIEPGTAETILRLAIELLLTMPPCQPAGALQVAIAERFRCEYQAETGAQQSVSPAPSELARLLLVTG